MQNVDTFERAFEANMIERHYLVQWFRLKLYIHVKEDAEML